MTAAASPGADRHRRRVREAGVPAGRLRGQEDPAALPLPHRRRRGPEGLHGRRDHGDRRRRRRSFTDNAETDDNGWTAKGFSRIGASFTNDYPQYYIAENRQYVVVRQDAEDRPVQLRLARQQAPDWVEHYPYQNGLLIWQWDTSQADNNVGAHPGAGDDPAGRRPRQAG